MSDAIDTAIDAALAARDYAQAAGLYDRLELDVATAGRPHPAPGEHLLCLLAADDLQSARFLWHRLHLARPTNGQARSEAEQAAHTGWALARALLSRDRPAFFAAAAAAHWPTHGRVPALASVVTERVRTAAADAVERAYSVVSAARLAQLVGLNGPDLAQFCVRRGWRLGDGKGDDTFVEIAVAEDAREELRLRARQEEENQMRRGDDDEASRIAQAAARSRAFDELRLLTKQLVRLQTTT